MRRGLSRYQRCYRQALERDSPTLSGKAVLTITLRESGEVEKVTVDFPAASPLFSQCLREATLKLWFRAEPHERVLVLPLSFDPGESRR
jgi:hypothetical protein